MFAWLWFSRYGSKGVIQRISFRGCASGVMVQGICGSGNVVHELYFKALWFMDCDSGVAVQGG